MEFRKINILNLKHAEYNPRRDLKPGDKEFEKIKNSINEFGYCDPIILNNGGNMNPHYSDGSLPELIIGMVIESRLQFGTLIGQESTMFIQQ